VSVAHPDGVQQDTPVAGPTGTGSRWRTAGRIAGGVMVGLGAIELSVLECFLVPLRVGRVPLPVALLLAIAGNLLLPRLGVAATGRKAMAVAPPVLWLLVVFVFAAPRPEGDLVVPGTLMGLLFLFGGAIAAAFGAARAAFGRQEGASGLPGRWTR
jgi:hypothetical protein